MSRQCTLKDAVSVQGVGVHTGKQCRVTVRPADENAGISFYVGGQRIPALAEYVVATDRCTTLGLDGARVMTVEHLLSALAGSGVDNAHVEVDGEEIPVLDGSAKPWVERFYSVGLLEQRAERHRIRLTRPVSVMAGDRGIWAMPHPERLLITTVHYDHPLIGTQVAWFHLDKIDYLEEIAPARTFGFWEEVEALLARGKALGGNLENALVIFPDRYSSPLRFPDEVLRHKVLDIIGDLALVGVQVEALFVAVKPSHTLNTAFALALRQTIQGE
ncbi:MAG: UDP-3-O-acyl-N-acetylglucosamine deacetylase [Armatimonadota bacterium]|nr:UDP-3-O-acyl-N-acetylglucosamine deacetylase [bacterium]MDW8321085.1 UDP-3-O-acyl-N-acetylglucosamine deacetylase [Armatimonadota bacterium]